MKKHRKQNMTIGDDYVKVQKKLNRELELERNGGRWIAVDRPWKNKKLYDRKRDRKINYDSGLFYFLDSLIDYLFCFIAFEILLTYLLTHRIDKRFYRESYVFPEFFLSISVLLPDKQRNLNCLIIALS